MPETDTTQDQTAQVQAAPVAADTSSDASTTQTATDDAPAPVDSTDPAPVSEKHSLIDELKEGLKDVLDWVEEEWQAVEAFFEGKKQDQ